MSDKGSPRASPCDNPSLERRLREVVSSCLAKAAGVIGALSDCQEDDDLVGNVGGGKSWRREGRRGLGDPGGELHGGGRDREAGEPRRRLSVQLQHLHRGIRGTSIT